MCLSVLIGGKGWILVDQHEMVLVSYTVFTNFLDAVWLQTAQAFTAQRQGLFMMWSLSSVRPSILYDLVRHNGPLPRSGLILSRRPRCILQLLYRRRLIFHRSTSSNLRSVQANLDRNLAEWCSLVIQDPGAEAYPFFLHVCSDGLTPCEGVISIWTGTLIKPIFWTRHFATRRHWLGRLGCARLLHGMICTAQDAF